MTVTYEITGFHGLAVRTGRALESWGVRAARPVDPDEQRIRHEAQRQAQVAFDARQNGCFGIGTMLR